MTEQPTSEPNAIQPVGPQHSRIQAAFIRNMHHELRTPLGVARGYTQLLNLGVLGDLNPEQRRVLLIMDRRLGDLQTIVERIEVLATTEAHLSPAVPLSPKELVTPIVVRQQAAARQAGLSFVFNAAPDLPQVYGDPTALAIALECLIENAVRFTPVGGQVTVQVQPEGDWVNFEIADTGIGIAPEKIADVLDGFCQADDSDSRRYGGLGLGLAVVKTVVQRHGGKLVVASKPEHGSQFTLQLPRVPARASSVQTLAEPSTATTRLRRILLVDDEINQVSILKLGLSRLPNCEIVTATSGRQALALCAQQPFDLMITDYRMPEMDGLMLASTVHDQYPATQVIMLTAFGSDVLSETATTSPVPLVLEKPIDLRHIRSAALNALNKSE